MSIEIVYKGIQTNLKANSSFQEVLDFVRSKILNEEDIKYFTLWYHDEERDPVTITSEADFQSSIYRIYVEGVPAGDGFPVKEVRFSEPEPSKNDGIMTDFQQHAQNNEIFLKQIEMMVEKKIQTRLDEFKQELKNEQSQQSGGQMQQVYGQNQLGSELHSVIHQLEVNQFKVEGVSSYFEYKTLKKDNKALVKKLKELQISLIGGSKQALLQTKQKFTQNQKN